jgi:hypothetical protein
MLLGCGYAALAIGLSIVGAQRQRQLENALRTGGHVASRSVGDRRLSGGSDVDIPNSGPGQI